MNILVRDELAKNIDWKHRQGPTGEGFWNKVMLLSCLLHEEYNMLD
jgi:hypothetical protein